MTDFALRTVDLGKRFRIGAMRARHQTLRDTLVQTAKRPIERLLHPGTSTTHKTEILWALRHLDLEIKPGETMGIIGKNGAGKSTLLKVLSHITDPSEGRVEIRGRVASLLEVGTGFHPELSGRENILLNGAILGMTRAEVKRKFDEIVDFSEIGRFLDTPVKRYSSGMYVRLAFSVAAHLDPEILVVDEVLAVGDAGFQRKCLGKMEDVAGHGRTVLFVSHNMQAVRTLCTSAVELVSGQMVNQGDAAEVVSTYLARLAESGSSRTWPKDMGPGNTRFRLRGLHVLDSRGGATGAVDTAEDAIVRVEVELTSPQTNFMVGVELVNNDGAVVLTSLSTDGDPEGWPQVNTGLNALECRIPAGLLNAGQYYVRPRFGVWGERSQRPDEAVVFEAHVHHMTSPHAHLPRSGIILPVLQWNAVEAQGDDS